MRPEDIHIGDRLRFREWDDMLAEFPDRSDSEAIRVNDWDIAGFTKYMRFLCGQPFTVRSQQKQRGGYQSEEGVEKYDEDGSERFPHWIIEAFMLEPDPMKPLSEESDADISSVLFS